MRRMQWKRSIGVLLWPASAGVVLAVAYAGIASIENSAASTRAVLQPARLVGSSNSAAPAALPAVIASVKAALHGDPIPSPLAPSFINLPTDWFRYPPGCEPHAGQTQSAICYVSGPTAAPSSTPIPGHKSVVVLGDSHAQMWHPALLAMAKKDGWDEVSVTKTSCTPAILYANTGAPSSAVLTECHTWYKWALKTIAKLRPDTIFISFHYSGEGRKAAMKTANGISSLTVWAKKRAKHVILMADIPDLKSLPLPVDCLQQRDATLRTCTGAWRGHSLDLAQALKALARLHHVGVIDPLGWFCYDGLCPQAIGHTIAYKDTNHASRTYATALSPPFRARFRAAIGTK